MKANSPFFIIGCVRSGTTMLRDILRMHPNLAAPEETHFYRWPEPFGTDSAKRQLLGNKTLARHRTLDSIDNAEFAAMLERARSRRDLYRLYMALYLRRNKPEARRWFDKTPQNVYGAAMLAADFPRARFVHIVRNPLDVVLSLRKGTVMQVSSLVGACNYWREAAAIIGSFRRAYPKRLFEIRYEEFTADPRLHTGRLLDFLDEPYDPAFMDAFVSRPKSHHAADTLSPRELRTVREICGPWAKAYGYDLSAGTQAAG